MHKCQRSHCRGISKACRCAGSSTSLRSTIVYAGLGSLDSSLPLRGGVLSCLTTPRRPTPPPRSRTGFLPALPENGFITRSWSTEYSNSGLSIFREVAMDPGFRPFNSRTRSGREDLTGSLAGVAAAPAVRLQVGARAGKVERRQTPRIWGNPAPAASATAAFLGGEGGGAGGAACLATLFSPTHPPGEKNRRDAATPQRSPR